MSGGEKHCDDSGSPITSFLNHDQSHRRHSPMSSPTFGANEHTNATSLPPFSSVMQTFPYDNNNSFQELLNNSHIVPSQQSFSTSLVTSPSDKHFYRSAVRSSELPNPLPIPPYSAELQNARRCGKVVDYRSMVIRETVKYFLKMKYWWTSEDYDCMARMVGEEFPDLRDPNVTPGQPDYIRIRAHLSQTARNLRRVAKNQTHRKLISAAANISDSNKETNHEIMSSPVVHTTKQSVSPNKTALPSVAHILSKQYLSPTPYPLTTASILPQMMSPSSILALPAYQKFLHSSLLAMSPGGMSALSQKLLSQFAAGSYPLPAFGHNPNIPCPVKIEPQSEPNQYGTLSSFAHSKSESLNDHHQVRESMLADSPEACESEDLPINFSSEHDLTHESAQDSEHQRQMLQSSHHGRNVSPARSSGDGILKESHQRPRSSSECEDDIKSPISRLPDEAELPNPLPIPNYSERVLTANEMGMTKDMRSTIIRETTTFFLNIKYRWTSSDYDRISSMVVSLFPALRDAIGSPGYAPTRRVRSDLSMCARNIRRRDVNKITTGYARKKSRASISNFSIDPRVSLKPEPFFSQYSEVSNKYWDQQQQSHDDIYGQTLENIPITDSAHNLVAIEIVKQKLLMNNSNIDDIETSTYNKNTNKDDLAGPDTGNPSESCVIGELNKGKTEQRDFKNVSAAIANRLHSFNREELRKENSSMIVEDENIDFGKSSFRQSSHESEDIRVEIQNKGKYESNQSVHKSVDNVTDTRAMIDKPEAMVYTSPGLLSNAEHGTIVPNETVVNSYTGYSAINPIGSYSASHNFKSPEGSNTAVHTDPNYKILPTLSNPNEQTFSPIDLIKCNRISASVDKCPVSSAQESRSSNTLIPLPSAVMTAACIESSTNQKHKTENYTPDSNFDLENITTTPNKTGTLDMNTSSVNSCGSSKGDSDSSLVFMPQCVTNLRTSPSDVTQREVDVSGMIPSTTVTSSLGEDMLSIPGRDSYQRQQMSTNEPCEKAGDCMTKTDRVLPHCQINLESPANSNIRLAKSYTPGKTLPDPLPVPAYSADVRKHQQDGRTLDMKHQIIKETVSFYLQLKSAKWNPTDYSRVVKMILLQFPEFKTVKMLKNMIFFTVRNLSNKRQFFQVGRYWKRKHRRFQHRQKCNTSDNDANTLATPTMDADAKREENKIEDQVDMEIAQSDVDEANANVIKPSADTVVGPLKCIPSQSEQNVELVTFDQMADMYKKVVKRPVSQTTMSGIEDKAEKMVDNLNKDFPHPTSQNLIPSNRGGIVQDNHTLRTDGSFMENQISEPHADYESPSNVLNPDLTDVSNTLQTQQDSNASTLQDSKPQSKYIPDYLRTSLTRQISLPNPLPVPKYSQQLLISQQDYTLKHNRLQIIRETVKYYLLIKYWWSSRDYERIAEMVITQFPGLADQGSEPDFPTYRKVRQELSMCARNLRRRFVWLEQQSNDRQQNCSNDAKDPITGYKEDPGREATHMDAVFDPDVKLNDYKSMTEDPITHSVHPAENSAHNIDQQQRQPLEHTFQSSGAYRNNVGRRLSPHEQHMHPSVAKASTNPLPMIKMKKTYVNPDHGNMLQIQLSQLWKERKYLDADLEVNGIKIQAHKLILLAMCPFLQSTLDQMDTKNRIEISMPENSSVEAVDAFLKYLYDGIIHINTDTVHSLSKIADMMRMQKLYKYCQDFLEAWNKEQQAQEGELNVCRLSLRSTDTDPGQSLHHGYQVGSNYHSAGPDSLLSFADANGGRQQYFQHLQSNQNYDNTYDANFKSKIPQFQNSNGSNASGMGNQRDGSLKVDRRISNRIANSYSRRTSGSSHTESLSDHTVKQESSLSGHAVVARSSADHKQEVESSSISEQSVFPQWWPSKM